MLNFDFFNPTKILFGKEQIQNIPKEIPANAKVLVLYGRGSIKTNGIYDQVMNSLSGYKVVEFGGIPANPEYEILLKALAIIKSEKIDFLLAVGGGSVIDGTKFLSAASLFEGKTPWEILSNHIRVTKSMPFGVVLTMPATGSEMNSGAVITRQATQEKLTMGGPQLFPQFSVLDPSVVASLPTRQLQNGIADAFTHVLEQYLTYPTTATLQERFAESILQTLVEIAPQLLNNPKDYNVASNYMWCCTMALNGLIQKGVPTDWATHMIGHELTALHGIDHARTLAIIGPNLYTFCFDDKKEKLAQLADRVWNLDNNNTDDKARKCIAKINDFFHSIGIKTKLSDYTNDYLNTAQEIEKRFIERGWKLGEHKKIGPEEAKEIIELSY